MGRIEPPDGVKPAVAVSWLSRLAGTALLAEQAAGHFIGLDSDLFLIGAGLFLLTGKEGIEFLRLLLSGRSQRP